VKRRAPRSGFTPRVKGNIIRAVGKLGEFRGKRGKQEFAIYRSLDGVLLLVAEGKRWRSMPAANVWDALETIEVLMRKRTYANCDASAETGERSQDGGAGPADCRDAAGDDKAPGPQEREAAAGLGSEKAGKARRHRGRDAKEVPAHPGRRKVQRGDMR
jgi:hypothetical protein